LASAPAGKRAPFLLAEQALERFLERAKLLPQLERARAAVDLLDEQVGHAPADAAADLGLGPDPQAGEHLGIVGGGGARNMAGVGPAGGRLDVALGNQPLERALELSGAHVHGQLGGAALPVDHDEQAPRLPLEDVRALGHFLLALVGLAVDRCEVHGGRNDMPTRRSGQGAASLSSSAAATAGLNRNPWYSSQPRSRSRASWSFDSTPSATTLTPKLCASATTARTIAASCASVTMPWMNERS